jgi:hypothetical protein
MPCHSPILNNVIPGTPMRFAPKDYMHGRVFTLDRISLHERLCYPSFLSVVFQRLVFGLLPFVVRGVGISSRNGRRHTAGPFLSQAQFLSADLQTRRKACVCRVTDWAPHL